MSSIYRTAALGALGDSWRAKLPIYKHLDSARIKRHMAIVLLVGSG